MRSTSASIVALAALGVAEASSAQFAAEPPVAVSGLSPFVDCPADEVNDGRALDSEVEPWIVVGGERELFGWTMDKRNT